jgi:alpha-tubulin suppressor-like RCC1 family protein
VSLPTTLLDLHGNKSLKELSAGKVSSAAVLLNGEIWTWGSGDSGKLGQGSAEQIRSPARVSVNEGHLLARRVRHCRYSWARACSNYLFAVLLPIPC